MAIQRYITLKIVFSYMQWITAFCNTFFFLQVLLETVGVSGPSVNTQRAVWIVSVGWRYPISRKSVSTQRRSSWQAWQLCSSSSPAAIYASQDGCRKTDLNNAMIAGKSTAEQSPSISTLSCYRQATLIPGKLGLLITQSQLYAAMYHTLGNNALSYSIITNFYIPQNRGTLLISVYPILIFSSYLLNIL